MYIIIAITVVFNDGCCVVVHDALYMINADQLGMAIKLCNRTNLMAYLLSFWFNRKCNAAKSVGYLMWLYMIV